MEKYIEFNGRRYCRDEVRGYYCIAKKTGEKTKYLHREVWEFYKGNVPDGSFVHHIDGDKSNNNICNLALMTSSSHSKMHIDKIMETEKEIRRKRFIESAHPKAKEWHRSEAGIAWHREHAKTNLAESRIKDVEKICVVCGEKYLTSRGQRNRSKFCSAKCCSKDRRDSGKDAIERTCAVCGKVFKTSRFDDTETCSKKCAGFLISKTKGGTKWQE